jgi:uncharacterized membrane protein YphA (DoxX/SURF4 family)
VNFKLTAKEFYLAIVVAISGWFLNSPELIKWLNTLNPIQGLFAYYVIWYSFLFFLSTLGLVVLGVKVKSLSQVLGVMLIIASISVITSWSNPYVQIVTKGEQSVNEASNVFYQSEDGVGWFLFYTILGIKDLTICRFLTFVVYPFVLCVLGGLLVSGRIRI